MKLEHPLNNSFILSKLCSINCVCVPVLQSLRQELSQMEESARQTSTQLQADLDTHMTAHRDILAELEST